MVFIGLDVAMDSFLLHGIFALAGLAFILNLLPEVEGKSLAIGNNFTRKYFLNSRLE